jgi:hypothetical protein
MSTRTQQELELQLLTAAIARLRASVMAVVFGLTGGTGLFVATVWLLVRGGSTVGPHLSLLDNYFPGYSVSWLGSVVGFFYGAASGAVMGWLLAWIYNRISDRRNRR